MPAATTTEHSSSSPPTADLRWGELGGLQRRHVDLGTGVVLVEQKLSEVNGVLEIDAPKTDAGRRSVALPALAVDELARHLRCNVEPLATSFVFTAAEGGYLRCSNFRRRVWIPATEKVGVLGFRFHVCGTPAPPAQPRPARRYERSCRGWATRRRSLPSGTSTSWPDRTRTPPLGSTL